MAELLAFSDCRQVWGSQVWGSQVWGSQVWGSQVWGSKVWGSQVWGSKSGAEREFIWAGLLVRLSRRDKIRT